MDFIQHLDPFKLLLGVTGLSFVLALGASPPYNLPILLFGNYALESNDAVQSLQTFTGLLGVSAIFDIIWVFRHEQHGFFTFLTWILILLKVPTFFAVLMAFRQRGGQFALAPNNLSGPTLWSMPGGFTSNERDGYQSVEEDTTFVRNPPKPLPAQNPTAVKQANTAPGGYQVV